MGSDQRGGSPSAQALDAAGPSHVTAPTATARGGRVPPGLAELHQKIDDHEGPWPADRYVVADIFGVAPKTVTGWASAELLAGMKFAGTTGWRYTKTDLRDFATRHYHAARRR